MVVARHQRGVRADVTALTSQVHPVFMLPPLAVSWYGALLAVDLDPVLGGLHTVAIFAAVYTAHVKDGYVDFYLRNEDDDHPLTATGCRWALGGATVVFGVSLLALYWVVDIWIVMLTLPCWIIAYHHAPQLDRHPLGATAGYPAGIALSLLGGHYVQSRDLSAIVVASAVVFFVLIAGIKIIDDSTDREYDQSIGKRTVAVLADRRGARGIAYGLFAIAIGVVLVCVPLGILPSSAAVACIAFMLVAVIAWFAEPVVATMLLIRGSYLFLAGLVAAVWLHG